jgi:hypothetical protein
MSVDVLDTISETVPSISNQEDGDMQKKRPKKLRPIAGAKPARKTVHRKPDHMRVIKISASMIPEHMAYIDALDRTNKRPKGLSDTLRRIIDEHQEWAAERAKKANPETPQ